MPIRKLFVIGMIFAATAISGGCLSSYRLDWEGWIPDGWVHDYDRAERRMRETSGGMLIFYATKDRAQNDAVFARVKTASDANLAGEYVRCMLFQTYEPDRRYVAQYGVRRAPALILIHPDGTYQAREGVIEEAQASQFMREASPPGEAPKINPYIPRQSHYVWLNSLDEARENAKITHREILIVFDRSYTDDWAKLTPMLERREVYARFANMVHCRPGGFLATDTAMASRFGVKNMPAIVILNPDGKSKVLEMPNAYESIVRFADKTTDESGAGLPAESEPKPWSPRAR